MHVDSTTGGGEICFKVAYTYNMAVLTWLSLAHTRLPLMQRAHFTPKPHLPDSV